MRSIIALAFLLFSTQVAFAQSPYRADVAGDRSALHGLASELHDGAVRMASPLRAQQSSVIRLSLNAAGLGRLKIVLDRVSYKSWDAYFVNAIGQKELDPKDVILVSGHAVDSSGKKHPLGGSLYNVNGRARLHLILNGNRRGSRSYTIKAKLGLNGSSVSARVSSVPSSAMKALGCGVDDAHDLSSHTLGANLVRAAGSTSGDAVVATDADPEYYAFYGTNTNAQIATIISAASAIYESQMGIKFTLGTQHAFTSSTGNPYTSSDANALLTSFVNYTASNNHLGSADVYHLFSGKDFDGSTIGLAYVGVVCQYPDYAFGTTQKFHDSAQASVAAHEIGHNFGAGHDNSDTSSIMAAYVSVPGSTYFSAASIAAIQNHLAGSPTCLDSYTGGGGGSGGGGDSNDPGDGSGDGPTITVSTSLSKKTNALKIKVTLSSLDAGCGTVDLIGGIKRSEYTNVLSFTPTSLSTSFTVSGMVDPKKAKSYLYFAAQSTCTSGLIESNVRKVALDTLSRKTSKSIRAVFIAIVNAFQ